MKIFWIICLCILILLLVAFAFYLIVGNVAYHICLARKGKIKKALEKNFASHMQDLKIDTQYFNQGFKKLNIVSEDQLNLFGFYKSQDSNKIVLFVHGYGGDHTEMANHAKYFEKRGYDILAIDQRCHGISDGLDLTMGIKESDDLLLWIKKLIEINSNYKIVLFGISMGASTVCMACAKDISQNVVLAIEDCGYDNAYKQFSYVYYNTKFHSKFIFKMFYNYTKKSKNFDLKKADATSKLKNVKIPMMFIHGGDDKFVPTEMVYALHSQIPEQRSHLYVADNAGHVASYVENPQKYEYELNKFLSKYYM